MNAPIAAAKKEGPASAQASAAFCAVWAAALANGGSFDNIQPGISYF